MTTLFVQIPFVFSEDVQVHKISDEGLIVLKSGTELRLAGLVLTPESFPILQSLLVHKQHVSLEYEKSPMNDSLAKPVYVYAETAEAEMPLKPDVHPRKKKILVNALLLSLGAARVDTRQNFKKKKDFIQLEAKARTEGQGIWSYDSAVPVPPEPEPTSQNRGAS
ncbi:MAG: thermonuclease family protein [Candidatus Omnitrophica bacterium]|nr:thermonuclease family protein [Candidatus Omnitrophota bacterium]